MRYDYLLQKLAEKLYFTIADIADILEIKRKSAWVLCSRYVGKGIFIRLKNNFYLLRENWNKLGRDDFLKLANFIQVPSYISFMTALSVYEITTQVQRNFFESAGLKRSLTINTQGAVFKFFKLDKRYYFDFVKERDIFIATREKALADMLYLSSFGKYRADLSSIDLTKLDRQKMNKILKAFPEKTRKLADKLWKG